MALSSISLPKPKNWQDFETMMRELFACSLNDPDTQKNGRSGQPQHGVDIYGHRNQKTNALIGIQCKEKYEEKVIETELRAEVEKAKEFRPPISEFFLVTTAPRDQKIQETARIITQELSQTNHPILIYVWGWDDIEEQAIKFPGAIRAIDPTWNPYVEKGFEDIKIQSQENIRTLVDGNSAIINRIDDLERLIKSKDLNDYNESTPLHGEITAFQRIIDDGQSNLGLQQFQKLKETRWANASLSERYRILTGIASADIQLGRYEHAGNMLMEAINEYPEYKNAQRDRATALLLTKDFKQAIVASTEILNADSNNSYIASILIQALTDESKCDDPLQYIPTSLYETEEVLEAYIHFLRTREDHQWIIEAKKAFDKYPDSRIVKQFWAEAILELTINENADTNIGGRFKTVNFEELKMASEILLREAIEAINNNSEAIPSIVHNAALALRWIGENEKAKDILNNALKIHPENENLLLQRMLIAFFDNNPDEIIDLVPQNILNPEMSVIVSCAYGDKKDFEKAFLILEKVNVKEASEQVKNGLIAEQIKLYLDQGQDNNAKTFIAHHLKTDSNNISFRIMQIRIYRLSGDEEEARNLLGETLTLITDQTPLLLRIQLSSEAEDLGLYDVIVDLLKEKISTESDSKALRMLISASISSYQYVTCLETLSSVSQSIKNEEWFQRAEAILALNTGEPNAGQKIDLYIENNHTISIDLILARIGIFQREKNDNKISLLLKNINLVNLFGPPASFVQLANLICTYDEVQKGLLLAYTTIMNHWDDPKTHLSYQGFIFFNEKLEMPSYNIVSENTVVCLATENGNIRYRIENSSYKFFEDEHAESDIKRILIGKKIGDIITLSARNGDQAYEILWIKHIYIDAFHRSLEYFNKRFPQENGLTTYHFNENSPDPLKDIREVMQASNERNKQVLKIYQSTPTPLAFISRLLGVDPIDAWVSLPGTNIKFQVCSGLNIERQYTLENILRNEKRGCIVDAITLHLVYFLGIQREVEDVCGPIHAPQSVIDVFMKRKIDLLDRHKQGSLSLVDGKLVLTKMTEKDKNAIRKEREEELLWIRDHVKNVSTMTKRDITPEAQKMLNIFGASILDSALASDGNDMLLLSEDMGFRLLSIELFNIATTWIQPILTIALQKSLISNEQYCEKIIKLVLFGHSYISLDANCLMYQVKKDDFKVTKELSSLLEIIGGLRADVYSNSKVLSEFFDLLCQNCYDYSKIQTIISEALLSFTKGRRDIRPFVWLTIGQMRIKKPFIIEHCTGWIKGHSFGMPYFDNL